MRTALQNLLTSSVLILMSLACAACGGCFAMGPSLEAYYSEATIHPVEQLVGVWKPLEMRTPDAKPGSAPFPAAEQAGVGEFVIAPHGNGRYTVTVPAPAGGESGSAVREFELVTFKLGSNVYGDLVVGEKDRTALGTKFPGFIVFTHWLLRISVSEKELAVQMIAIQLLPDPNAPRMQLEWRDAEFGTPQSAAGPLETKMRLCVSDTRDLQREVIKAEAAGIFDKDRSLVFKRIAPEKK